MASNNIEELKENELKENQLEMNELNRNEINTIEFFALRRGVIGVRRIGYVL